LRVSEASGLKLDQIDTESRVFHVAWLKGGIDDAAGYLAIAVEIDPKKVQYSI
jgi:hypothetical protein